MGKIGTIKHIYYDQAGYGSKQNTLADVKKGDPFIKRDDVNIFSISMSSRRSSYTGKIVSWQAAANMSTN